MATFLYRLGTFSYRRAWVVITTWLIVLLAALGLGLGLGGTPQDSYTIPGTESQQALDQLASVFPETAGASVQLVLQAPEGERIDSEANRALIEDAVGALEKNKHVASALSPFSEYAGDALSDDGRTAIIQAQLDQEPYDVEDATKEALIDTAQPAEDAGLRVAFGGQVFQDFEFGLTIVEVIGVVFAAVVLIVTFGSLLAAGMPLLVALVGVGVTMGGLLAVSAGVIVSTASPMLALMLGIAVGIDYSLFIISRHRSQLADGMDVAESAARSVATAGSAVVFAGATVIIALLGLLVVGIPFLSIMGVAAAIAVLLAVLAAVTLLPAVARLAGERLRPRPGSRTHRRAVAGTEGKKTLGARWVNTVMKAPALWLVAVVAILGVLSIPAASLNLNLPSGASEPQGSQARIAYDLITEGFGPGANGLLVAAVDITQTTDVLEDLDTLRDRFAALDGVASVSEGIPNRTVDTAIFRITPQGAPDSEQTKQLVHDLRDLEPSIAQELDTPYAVTGATAVAVDISNRLSAALIPFALLVVGLSIILLAMVFRSVLIPLKAAIGFLLSIGASIGTVVAIFQWGWLGDVLGIAEPGPILSFLPIIMMALLFGLAMDYEMFLVSGIREEYVHGSTPKQAIKRGSADAMRVVTAAALIMVFVFAAFVPEGSGVIKGIALGLAVGIFFDAFLVRMTFGPAVLALLGKSAWWLPRWLQRALPNVDVEGVGLSRYLDAAAWARAQEDAITVVSNVGTHQGEVEPVTLPRGGILLVTGPEVPVRDLVSGLAARGPASFERAQLLGLPLPGAETELRKRVSYSAQPPRGLTVGALLTDRLYLATFASWRTVRLRRRVDQLVDATRTAAAEAGIDAAELTAASDYDTLPTPLRAIVLAAAAYAEKPRVAATALPAGLDEDAAARVVQAAAALAPLGTTVIIGIPGSPISKAIYTDRPLKATQLLAATTKPAAGSQNTKERI